MRQGWSRLSQWLRRGGIVVVAAGMMGVLGGAGLYTAQHAEALSYLSNDPKACANCHIMREVYDGWQKASHHHVAVCVDCHLPHDFIGKYLTKVEHGWNHSRAFTMQDFHEPIQIGRRSAAVVEHNCVQCHQGLIGGVLQAQTAFQDAHAGFRSAGDGSFGCVHCHRGVGHGE
ncbi:cytochrome c nitrate reductase, small subunit [Allomeiothermus silvanus DSM 9946]|uniref:Cytochrome c-type protein n=1 Tax=Allomeiothermus silvanus (strain ATCC 700542 / DSM 9946 / NBRC 106475 / NCIMB 13440 / VI-R2) TaxID=526227 RepID=D7BH01_ALLS1|nr:cytochrome c nitrite reductase small subunit [Allomeiothermus silvanus]ADH63854.1 cytochrome c nitrate reductase, small subunit [Allomeiothermus silvanus DSM 9946]